MAHGGWSVLDASERLLAGADLMDGLGRRGAVERLAEGPRDAQDYREGLVGAGPRSAEAWFSARAEVNEGWSQVNVRLRTVWKSVKFLLNLG